MKPLKIALKAPKYLTIFSVVLFVIVVAATCYCFISWRRKKEKVSPSLLESTDSAIQPEEVRKSADSSEPQEMRREEEKEKGHVVSVEDEDSLNKPLVYTVRS